jgi:hypothetical protein
MGLDELLDGIDGEWSYDCSQHVYVYGARKGGCLTKVQQDACADCAEHCL